MTYIEYKINNKVLYGWAHSDRYWGKHIWVIGPFVTEEK